MKYLLVINGRPQGPFTVDELKLKGLKPADFVRTDGMDDYKEAHELPGVTGLIRFSKLMAAPQYFGSFDQRLLASVLDWFIVSAGFVVLACVAVLFINDRIMRALLSISLLIIIPLANLIYHIIMECSAKQATYGKQLLRIRVTDMAGQRLDAARASGRNLAKMLSVLTFILVTCLLFFNKQQQCLHDMVAGTLVVKDRLI